MLRLGIMGGTFDPLHWGHLVMAEQAREAFSLDRVVFITAGQPPHKIDKEVSNAEHRYAMTALGIASNSFFEASRIEIDSQGLSYSVNTLRRLRDIYGEDAEICLIIGADEALDIQSWREADKLPQLARFLVAPRPCLDTALLSTLPEEFVAVMDIIPMPFIGISSTDIRARVHAGQTIRYLVPDTVEAYIYQNRLYLGEEIES